MHIFDSRFQPNATQNREAYMAIAKAHDTATAAARALALVLGKK